MLTHFRIGSYHKADGANAIVSKETPFNVHVTTRHVVLITEDDEDTMWGTTIARFFPQDYYFKKRMDDNISFG